MFNTKHFFYTQFVFLLPLLLICLVTLVLFPSGDYSIFFKNYGNEHPTIQVFMESVSDFGSTIIYLMYFVFIYYNKSKVPNLKKFIIIYTIVNIIFSVLIVEIMKISIGKPRPHMPDRIHKPFSFDDGYDSLPSGHTTEIYNSSGMLSQLAQKLSFSFFLGMASALVAFSRVFLNNHFIIDILSSAVLSSSFVLLSSYLLTKKFDLDFLPVYTKRIFLYKKIIAILKIKG